LVYKKATKTYHNTIILVMKIKNCDEVVVWTPLPKTSEMFRKLPKVSEVFGNFSKGSKGQRGGREPTDKKT